MDCDSRDYIRKHSGRLTIVRRDVILMNRSNPTKYLTNSIIGQLLSLKLLSLKLLLIVLFVSNNIAQAKVPAKLRVLDKSNQSNHFSVDQLNDIYQLSRGLSDAGYYQHALRYAVQAYQSSLTNRSLTTLVKVAIANNLAVLKTRLEEYSEARNLLRGLVVTIKSERKELSPVMQRQLLFLQINLFDLNVSAHEYRLAENNWSAIYAIERKIYSSTHPVLIHQKFIKISLEYEKGNYRGARKMLISHWSHLPSGKLYNEARAESRLLGARINIGLGNLRVAYDNLNRALKWQGLLDSELTAKIYKQLSYLSLQKGVVAGALGKATMYHKKHVNMVKRLYGNKHPRTAEALIGFMKYSRSLSTDDKNLVLEIYARSFGLSHPQTLKVRHQLMNRQSVNNQAGL